MTMFTFDEAKQILADALRQLDAAGPEGFEGLMRDVLTEITGRSFRLAKSGPQGGSDVRAVNTNTFKVGLEGKRYGENTRLGLDELRAKVFDAASQDDPVDLWMLAATREISATDQEALEKTARSQGLSTMVLDWPSGATIPDLAIICISAPTALNRHLGHVLKLTDAVLTVQSHPTFAGAQERLRKRLTSPDMGYAAAAAAMRTWILGGLASEASAGSRLGGRGHNVLAEADKRVPRKTQSDQLDKWFENRTPGALVGDEGMGKTWSFLSWWVERSSGSESLPLTIFVSAKDIRDETAEEMMVRLLAARLDIRDVDFWRRRVGQWRKAVVDGPQFILVIDGLNQNWTKTDWAEFLQPLYDERWDRRVVVLMTCWPDHWANLRKLAPLTPEPVEMPVGPFSDPELDLVLAGHGLSRERFAAPMLTLMKVPRLSRLAITRHQALAQSGDITPERLAYEDWKYRVSRRGAALAIGDDEFLAFVEGLGETLKNSVDESFFTRKDLLDRLGRDSGRDRADLSETLGEIVAGRWLETGSKPHQFRVNPKLTPFVLGLTLANELKGVSEDAQIATMLAEFLDPFKGQSLGVAILRAATTVALLDPQVGRGARRAVLKRWLAEQNFHQPDFDAYWRLIGLDVDLICENIEETWLARGGTGVLTDEILIKGMAQAYRFPEVAHHLVQRAEKWLGWIWADPDQGRFLGRGDSESQRSKDNRARTRANLEKWQAIARPEWPSIEPRLDGDVSWFSHRALGMLSFLPRLPFVRAFAAWSLGRAIMGVPRHIDEVGWVLRVNQEDQDAFRPVLDKLIERLIAVDDHIAITAAKYLLEAAGDPAAQAKLDILEVPEPALPCEHEHWVDPCDPLSPPPEIKQVEMVDGAQLWMHHRQTGDADLRFARDKTSLARLDPQAFNTTAAAAVNSAEGRTNEQLWGLLNTLRRILILIPADDREKLAHAIDRVVASGAIADDKELVWWRARRLEILLWSAPPEEQLAIIRDKCLDVNELALLDKALPRADQAVLRRHLSQFLKKETRQGKLIDLYYLSKRAFRETLKPLDRLAPLLTDEDADVRQLAWELASTNENPAVCEAVAASGWASRSELSRAARAYGSGALLTASGILRRPELLDRADPEVVALQLLRNPDDPAALVGYEHYVRAALDGITVVKPGPIANHWVLQDEPMRTLVLRSGSTFSPWLADWLDRTPEIPNHAFFLGEFPLICLCQALFEAGDPLAERFWAKVMNAMSNGVFKYPELSQIPMRSPAVDTWDTVRMGVITSATTDQDLAATARSALKFGHAAWLEQVIRDCEATGRASNIAKAYALLGFADVSPEFDAVWEDFSNRKLERGWLAHVYGESRKQYDRNRWARHWYQAYINAEDPADAYAAYELLLSCADRRSAYWLKGNDLDGRPEFLQRHWNANATDLNSAIKKRHEELKNTLFFTQTMSQSHAPWL